MSPLFKENILGQDTKDIVKGTLANFIGVLARSLNFIFYIFLAQVYGPAIVGIFVVSRSSVDIVSKLGILGFDRGVLSVAAKHRASDDEEGMYRAIGQGLMIGLLATAMILCLFQVGIIPVVGKFFKRLDLVMPLRIMGFGIVFWTISAVLLFATRALRIMRYEIIVKNVIEPLAILLFAIPFYFFGWGITGLAIAFLLSVAVAAAFSIYFYSREFSLKKTAQHLFSKEGRRGYFWFASPIGLYDMLNLLLQRVDLFILSHFAGSATVGVYSIAQNIAFTFKKIRQSFDPIFIPVISASHQLKDRDALLEQYRNVARWVLILNTALFGLTVFAGHTILRIFGGEFVVGATALIILTAAVIINSFLGISELFILIDRPYINLINTIGSIGAAIILNYALVPEFGMLGACMAFLATYLLMNAARIIEVWLLYRLHPFTRYHARALLAAVPSFAAVLFIRGAIPLTHGVTGEFAAYLVFFLLYVVSLVLMGMAKEEETFLAKIISLFKKNDSENM